MSIAYFNCNNTIAYGNVNIDDRNKAHIRIESETLDIINLFEKKIIIEAVINNENYFFYDLFMITRGYITNNRKTLFFIEFDAYSHGVGCFCEKLENLKIKEMCVSFNYLSKWILGINYNFIKEENHLKSLKKQGFGENYVKTYKINDNLELDIQVYGTRLKSFQEVFQICFRCKSLSFQDYIEEINLFSRFLSLMCFTPVEVNEKITCFTDNTVFNIFQYKWIKEKHIYNHFLISYSDLKKSFKKIITNYYNDTRLHPPFTTLTSSLYIEGSSPGGEVAKFLNILKSVDAMYENVLFDFSKQEKKYREKINKIVKTIPHKKDREFISNKLCLSHKATSIMKLRQFLIDCIDILKITSEQTEKLARILQTTRNYYTHLLKNQENVIKENSLEMFNEVLISLINYRLIKHYNNNKIPETNFQYLQTLIEKYFNKIADKNFETILCTKKTTK